MSEKSVQLNEKIIKGPIKELVRGSMEEALNELPEKEAESPVTGRTLSIRLRGRHLPVPQLGRIVRKCCCFGSNRRK